MDEKIIKTGIEGFDEDVLSFVELLKSDGQNKLIEILEDHTLTFEDFFTKFPEWATRLGIVFNNFGTISDKISKDSEEFIDKIKNEFLSTFPTFIMNPHIKKYVENLNKKKTEYIKDFSNVPSRISYDFSLTGNSKCLTPKIRIVLVDKYEEKTLYDMIISVSDLLFISKSLTEISSDLFKTFEDLFLEKRIPFSNEDFNNYIEKIELSKTALENMSDFIKKLPLSNA
jgi:hypothetical protein